jgi:hypothetical protein
MGVAQGMNAQQNEATRMIAIYIRRNTTRSGFSIANHPHELASYGPFQGFKIPP